MFNKEIKGILGNVLLRVQMLEARVDGMEKIQGIRLRMNGEPQVFKTYEGVMPSLTERISRLEQGNGEILVYKDFSAASWGYKPIENIAGKVEVPDGKPRKRRHSKYATERERTIAKRGYNRTWYAKNKAKNK